MPSTRPPIRACLSWPALVIWWIRASPTCEDLERLKSEMLAAAPEIVIHMAAQPLVRDSYRIPVETYAINVMGTVHLLEAVRGCPSVRAVVNVTTDKVYENREWPWGYRENEPFGGYDPYSNSKGCSELATAAYRSSYFNPSDYARHGVALASARAGNVIGGGDWAGDRLVPDIIRSLLAGRGGAHPQPPRHPPLAACAGTALWLPCIVRKNSISRGRVTRRGWNFGPAGRRMPGRWSGSSQRMCRQWGKRRLLRDR